MISEFYQLFTRIFFTELAEYSILIIDDVALWGLDRVMTFENLITFTPEVYEADHAADIDALFRQSPKAIRTLLSGVASCSPYLKSLMQKEQEWLQCQFAHPDTAIETEFARLRGCPSQDLASELRRAKRRVALWSALCDIAGIWPLETVTQKLTEFADLSVELALGDAVRKQIKRGKLPGFDAGNSLADTGIFVLAMGKMGAYELNYSSDIDLIVFFDEAKFDTDVFYQARASFIKATREMAATLSDLTGEGYVFRTDLRLRPDPSVTPVCMGIDAAERYYESLGRTWERAAYIKARVCAGDHQGGEAFLNGMRPFVWRKHLDFAAIEDAHNMRVRIREHKGLGGKLDLSDHNMKLGRGGIREIEFFTQTRQIIAGGRDPDLRVRGTLEGLAQLQEKGWISDEVCDRLSDHYRYHRTIEHRLQMINDAQTHNLPTSDAGFDRLAAFVGTPRPELEETLRDRLEEVHSLTEGFFAPGHAQPADPVNEQETEVTARWASYPALRSERAEGIFNRLKPEILKRLRTSARPDEALIAFDGFLAGLPAGVQLFSLFEANPQLIDLLLDIVGTSPVLAQYLSRNAKVFDAVIGGSFWQDWPDLNQLVAELDARLAQEPDYEAQLDAARRWGKEWHFRIGVHMLRDIISPQEASRQYADLAEAMLKSLWPVVMHQFAQKHGAAPGRGAVVLGMGSLGVGRLHAHSDLDLIVIYDAQGVDQSDGRRPLASRAYYARLTQALVTAMTAPMAEGRLYEVDMRLRPSGNKGPVATSLQSFRDYQINDAWVWEHLALTRARVVAGPIDLAHDVEAFRHSLMGKRDRDQVKQALAKMRARIAEVKPSSQWDLKTGAGRLQDIELFSQLGLLLSGEGARATNAGLDASARLDLITQSEAKSLGASYAVLSDIHIVTKLLSEDIFDPHNSGQDGLSFVIRAAKETGLVALDQKIGDSVQVAAEIIAHALPEPEEGTDER